MDVGGPKVPQIQPKVNVESSNPSDSARNPSDLPQNGHKKTPNPSDLTRNGHRRTPNSSDSPPNPSDSPQNGHWGRGGDVKPLRFDPQILQIYPKMDMGGDGTHPTDSPPEPLRFAPKWTQEDPKPNRFTLKQPMGPKILQIRPTMDTGGEMGGEPLIFAPKTPQICPKMDMEGPQTPQIRPKANRGTPNPSVLP